MIARLSHYGDDDYVEPDEADDHRETLARLIARERDISAEAKNECGVGMCIAAAILMRTWGRTVECEAILGAAGVRSVSDMKKWGVDEYDIGPLRPVVAEMRRKQEPER